MCGDPAAAGRVLVDDTHVKVAEDGHGDGPGNRRRRHHEHVGSHVPGPPRRQRSALLHAETVLLIDDDESEVGEVDRVLEQGMGAHDDACFATRDGGELLASLLGRLGAREIGHARADVTGAQQPRLRERAQQAANGPQMLLREDLGGREHRRLRTRIHHLEHGAQGDEGLATADIALEEPLHGVAIG